MVKQAINSIQIYFKDNDINFLDVIKRGKKHIIDFTINSISYVSKTELENIFHFELAIKETKRGLVYEINTKEGSKIPFHPHFHITEKLSVVTLVAKKAKWIDYERRTEDITSFVERMILSLQYNKEYINIDAKRIGNDIAKQWYLEESYRNEYKFPTDFFLQKSRSITSISQELNQTKKFEIDSEKKNLSASMRKKPKVKKKFNIIEESNYTPQKKVLTCFNINKKLNSIANKKKSSSLLYITEKSRKQIWDHISWGNSETTINRNEQGGILIGKVYFDEEKQIEYGVVEQVIAGNTAEGNPVYLEMSHETWSEMLAKADLIIEKDANVNLQIIGWYHTHPNQLDVFMSTTDLNTQHQFFNQDWHYAIVLNPHRQIWKAFVGKKANECKGYFLKQECNDDTSITTKNNQKPSKLKGRLFLFLFFIPLSFLGIWEFQKYKVSTKATNIKDTTKVKKDTTKVNQIVVKSGIISYSNKGDPLNFTNIIPLELCDTLNIDSIITFKKQLFTVKDSVIFMEDSNTVAIEKKYRGKTH